MDYTDDIYVGYRYFETIPGALAKVNYPLDSAFRTQFDWQVVSVSEKLGQLLVQVDLTNVGKRPGKEVLQVYGMAPQGKTWQVQEAFACV